ncbi:grpE protein homolog 1, mitochondrial [Rhopalosiphum maidis]|uniref:grpE protein homolog 1, mitochondrial n=1 Tax=Rhopalosiphum maidis TaxID=43146 RepID=UPI000EFFF067|nr:grpE protein homolog 1, mitochondrial [Rhopalosiphum maidis]XP_026811480.1 grpE protein homolog 1, mitochondrial [Rhopalosiphum maidis]
MTSILNYPFRMCRSILSTSLATECRINGAIGYNILHRKVSDAAADNAKEPLKESKEKIDIEALVKQNEDLIEENKNLTEKVRRYLAETENIRKRTIKETADAKIYAIQGFCKDLLDVADSLSKATECVPKEEVCDSNPHLKHLYEGLVTTESQLQTIFQRHGLMSINPLNEKFDPNSHKALFEQVVEGKEGGIVVVVSQIGYKLHDRIVRAAAVGISKDPNQ